MQTADYDEFKREMSLLCEAFDRKPTQELNDAYWEALERMSLRDFKRAARAARAKSGTEGMTRMPAPGKFWELRNIGERAEPVKVAPVVPMPPEHIRFSNHALLGFLMRWPGPIPDPDNVLPRLVAEKNKLAKQLEILATEDELTLDLAQKTLQPRLEAIMREAAHSAR